MDGMDTKIRSSSSSPPPPLFLDFLSVPGDMDAADGSDVNDDNELRAAFPPLPPPRGLKIFNVK